MWCATNPTAPWRSWHGRFHPFVYGIYRLYKVIRELSIRSERFTTLEFEGHSSAGVNGHCVDNGQPEFFVKLVDGVQLLHLEHESSDGFCLGFPCSFVVRSCSSRALAFSYRSTNPLYRAAYSSWFCAVCEFSAMQRFVSSVTTSISSSRLSISVSIPVQSVRVACINRQSSRMLSLLSMIALRAVTNRALMVSSSRCGVSHLCSPLNLLLHCQMTLRYFEVEFQIFEPILSKQAKKKSPENPFVYWTFCQ